jgi:hypothetical protein
MASRENDLLTLLPLERPKPRKALAAPSPEDVPVLELSAPQPPAAPEAYLSPEPHLPWGQFHHGQGLMGIGGDGSPTPWQRISFEIGGAKFQTVRHGTVIERKADQMKPVKQYIFPNPQTAPSPRDAAPRDAAPRDAAPPAPLTSLVTKEIALLPGPAWAMLPHRGGLIHVTSPDFAGSEVAPDLAGSPAPPAPPPAPPPPPPRAKSVHIPNLSIVQVGRPSPLKGIEQIGIMDIYPKALRKRVPHVNGQEGDWGVFTYNNMPDDQDAMPSPKSFAVDNQIPCDRVFLAPGPFGANNGFMCLFTLDHQPFGWDKLFRIYFGGETPVHPSPQEDPRSHGAGIFCLELYGNGQAILYERSYPADWEANDPYRQDAWASRFSFQWANRELIGKGYQFIWFLPYDRNRIIFMGGALATGMPGGFTLINLLVIIAEVAIDAASHHKQPCYLETPKLSGHSHDHVMTGIGPLRVDMRRDIRTPWQPLRLKFPPTSTLVDAVIELPPGLPDQTPMTFRLDQFNEAGGWIDFHLYNADTGQEIPWDPDQHAFTIPKGTKQAVPYFVFHSDGKDALGNRVAEEDYFATPVLHGYRLTIAGLEVIQIDPWEEVRALKKISVLGPDIHDYMHECAGVSVQDIDDSGHKLRELGRIHTRICLRARDGGFDRSGNAWGNFDADGIPGTLLGVLFEGEVDRRAPPRAHKRGRLQNMGRFLGEGSFGPGIRSRGDNWWRYPAVRQSGMGARLVDCYNYGSDAKGSVLNFWDSADGPEGAGGRTVKTDPKTGRNLPWKVTDALWKLFRVAGCLNEEIDIPDYDTRFIFTHGDDDSKKLQVMPGQRLDQPILQLTRDWLMGSIIREPNARPASATIPGGVVYGMWRFLSPARLAPVDDIFSGLTVLDQDPIRMEFWSASFPRPDHGKRVITAMHALDSFGQDGVPQVIIEDDTFDLWTEPPEANYVRVLGGKQVEPQEGGGKGRKTSSRFDGRYEQELYNYRSLVRDPDHDLRDPNDPSYLDAGLVPLVIADSSLGSQAEVDFVCARYFDFACFARFWGTWRSPLRLIEDTSDRGKMTIRDKDGFPTGEQQPCLVDEQGAPTLRPLRPQDLVGIHVMYPNFPGGPPEPQNWLGLVANCNPESSSVIHKMGMEVLILRTVTETIPR